MPEVKVENLGPIESFGFKLNGYGVTVLRSENGRGKSILLGAIASAVKGSGRPPLRDEKKRGSVEFAGARITLGQSVRHTGEAEVQHLEGRFSLAELVDPGMKSAEANDARRIKALVQLTGVAADPELFRSDKAMIEFDKVVMADSLKTDDLVEMARRIKDAYDAQARYQTSEADKAEGKAQGCAPPANLNLDDEHDAKVLQQNYDRLVQHRAELRASRRAYDEARSNSNDAVSHKERSLKSYTGPTVAAAEEAVQATKRSYVAASETVRDLEYKLAEARKNLVVATGHYDNAQTTLELAKVQVVAQQAFDQVIQRFDEWQGPVPTDDELEYADGAVDTARVAMEHGALIREAKRKQSDAETYRKEAAQARERAERYRDAGRATDDVLSSAIKCEALKVESDGKSARLTAWCERRGKRVPYQDLSEGQRWKIAIDLGADQVGEGGLLVIDQHAWEGLDAFVRPAIHQHAVERRVYILSAEATRDPGDDPTLHAVPYGEK